MAVPRKYSVELTEMGFAGGVEARQGPESARGPIGRRCPSWYQYGCLPGSPNGVFGSGEMCMSERWSAAVYRRPLRQALDTFAKQPSGSSVPIPGGLHLTGPFLVSRVLAGRHCACSV